jgi:lysophospholipase L1-like esterase
LSFWQKVGYPMTILKRSLFIIALLFCCTLLTETVAMVLLQRFQPTACLVLRADTATLVWTRSPIWPFYEVEVFPTALAEAAADAPVKPLKRYFSWQDQLDIANDFPFPTSWRVGARGLLHRPLGSWSEPALLRDLTATASAALPNPVKPRLLRQGPTLTWTSVPGAVYYEIEFLSAPPENPNGIMPSKHRLYSSREVFVRGYHPDLRAFAGQRLYWRVRALDLGGNPLGVFSDIGAITATAAENQPLRPLIISDYAARNAVPLLYPVYEWIPIQGADSYEVELTRLPPENPDSASPSRHRIWHGHARGFDLYDEMPRLENGRYYYRVRGLGRDGNPVGLWSAPATFDVNRNKASLVATFGDSITHGGGAVSYAPSDWEYSYQSYLKFPTYNLGRSSDTATASVERFDQDVLPFQPKNLIIMTGANSIRAGVPAESLIHDLSAIRDKCLHHGIRPIFLTLPPINPAAIARAFNETTAPHWQESLLTVNDWIREQPYYVDLYPHFADKQGLLPTSLAIDGLHYDIAGKKLMAALINAHWDELSRLW